MGSLKEVRNRIVSVKSTQQITRAMKVVSAAKLRKAQQRITQMRPYALKLKDLLSHLSTSLEGSDAMKYFEERPVRKVLLVIVTSDRGLAGSFNSVIVKEAVKALQSKYSNLDAANVDVLTVGKKGGDVYRKTKHTLVDQHNTMFSNLTYEASEAIANKAMQLYVDGTYDAVDVVYNQFKNAAVYIPTVERFLPVPVAVAEVKADDKNHKHENIDYIFEPSKEEIVAQLITQSLRVNFFRTLLESNAAEHGARMTAMDKATDNAEDLLNALKLQYNKERQASITKEILEIVGGAKALNG
jgi:F-type H+-transporting ATPase subunit gamma